MSGNGTQEYPWDFATALGNPGNVIKPGHKIIMTAGTYAGDYGELAKIIGSSGSEITILPVLGASPIIDGSLYSRGQHQIIRDIEVKDADFTNRDTLETGSNPSDIPDRNGFRAELTAGNIRYVNCIIHDAKEGPLADNAVPNIEYYGLIVFYNGWSAPDRGHGHAIYCGNKQSNGGWKKTIDCVLFWNFAEGLHYYAEGPALDDELLYNLHVEGTTLFQNGDLAGVNRGNVIGGTGRNTTVRISSMKNCCSYQDKWQIGGISTGCTDFVLQDNIIVGDMTILYYGNKPTIAGNVFYGTVTITNGDTGLDDDPATDYLDNEYHASGVPDAIDLRANQYDSNKAKLTIFNGSQLDNLQVDVSSVFNVGDTIKAHNVQDYFVDIQTLTVAGDGTITVNMQAVNRSVATPVGWSAPATTFPDFGCFRLVRQ